MMNGNKGSMLCWQKDNVSDVLFILLQSEDKV